MTDTLPLLLSVSVLWSAAVAAPGPNLFVVMRTSLTNGRPTAMAVALRMALVAGIWGLAGFFSIHAVFAAAPLALSDPEACGHGISDVARRCATGA